MHSSLQSLYPSGRGLIELINKADLITYKKDIEHFFSLPADYKKQYSVENVKEHGYYDLNHKEYFAVRNQQLPPELSSCVSLFEFLHQLAIKTLFNIADEMEWGRESILNITKQSFLPTTEKS